MFIIAICLRHYLTSWRGHYLKFPWTILLVSYHVFLFPSSPSDSLFTHSTRLIPLKHPSHTTSTQNPGHSPCHSVETKPSASSTSTMWSCSRPPLKPYLLPSLTVLSGPFQCASNPTQHAPAWAPPLHSDRHCLPSAGCMTASLTFFNLFEFCCWKTLPSSPHLKQHFLPSHHTHRVYCPLISFTYISVYTHFTMHLPSLKHKLHGGRDFVVRNIITVEPRKRVWYIEGSQKTNEWVMCAIC